MHETAEKIVRQIQRHDFKACFVGGAVRDMLSGKRCKDIDIVTSATPDELREIFPEIIGVGACFGVSLLKTPAGHFEIATAREERNYLDGRHPESVLYTRDLLLDLRRRDFTINAMLYDPVSGEIIDPNGGREDLRRGIVRTVGTPEERFAEDYLRMLRAVRFAARMRFELEHETAAAIRKLAEYCRLISPERIRGELDAMLTGPDPARAMRLLQDLGIMRHILPEVSDLDGVEQMAQYHPEGDVFIHTMLMLEHMKYPDRLLAWAVLLHDIGKKPCSSVDETGRIRFFGHETTGSEMARQLLDRLRFATNDTEQLVTIVRRHMNFAQVPNMKRSTLTKLLGSPTFTYELELNRLDCISSHALFDAYLRILDEIIARNGELAMPEAFIRGEDLIALGGRPGKLFGQIIRECYERQLAGTIPTRQAARDFAAAALQSNALPV